MKAAEINRIVERAYTALDVLNNISSCAPYRDMCYTLARGEELRHRRGRPDCVALPKGASVNAAARFFVVNRIAEALTSAAQPNLASVIHWQPSALYAASLVANYRDTIGTAWHDAD